jgi:transposase
VKPYVKTNKNDSQDAEAICEAVTRPNMRFVAIKSIEQQDILSLHRVRSRLISQRTALVNHVRALLSEYGVILPQGITHIRSHLRPILGDTDNELTSILREVLYELLDEFLRLDERVKALDHKLKGVCTQSDACKRLLDIPGIGPITASALVSSIGDIHQFKNARHLSAWLGLVPKQHSSGSKQTLLGISKRGDTYLRKLLIHGARAVLFRYKQASEWMKAIVMRRGFNKACVALANKTARIVWALLSTGERYQKVSIRSVLP